MQGDHLYQLALLRLLNELPVGAFTRNQEPLEKFCSSEMQPWLYALEKLADASLCFC